jgi:hypothetical protein
MSPKKPFSYVSFYNNSRYRRMIFPMMILMIMIVFILILHIGRFFQFHSMKRNPTIPGQESILTSYLFLNFISDVQFGHLKLITILYLKLFIILIRKIRRAEEERSYPRTIDCLMLFAC